ncbi:MAG: hypothetical protein BWZ10_03527 [candidate division BRC1 bacterium ADurb.BinA364]|nr:MAG: hypothetical protein BWZ10_03527 [candidate division BRC1 bacterium ADurb.BinA364]
MARSHPVIRHAGHNAALGEILRLLVIRKDVAAAPSASVEKHHGRPLILRGPIFRHRKIDPQLALRRLFVDMLLVSALFAFGRELFEVRGHIEVSRAALCPFRRRFASFIGDRIRNGRVVRGLRVRRLAGSRIKEMRPRFVQREHSVFIGIGFGVAVQQLLQLLWAGNALRRVRWTSGYQQTETEQARGNRS